MTAQVLYRLYDANRVLLYVGSTASLQGRLGQHAVDKPWWPRVASIVVAQYESRGAVREAEQAAIDAGHPIYNQCRVVGKTPMKSFRIPEDLYRDAQATAATRGESLSDVVRQALEGYLAR